MGNIIVPPTRIPLTGSLIFLVGPIKGASDWQKYAIQYLAARTDATIASPRRPDYSESEDFDEEKFNEQTDWEHDHLYYAARHGVTLAWLARHTEIIPGRAHAQTTRYELGEAATLNRVFGIRLVVGIEKGFSGERYLRRTMGKKNPNVCIFSDLTQTCEEAIKLLYV
jgi:hypothetical protein